MPKSIPKSKINVVGDAYMVLNEKGKLNHRWPSTTTPEFGHQERRTKITTQGKRKMRNPLEREFNSKKTQKNKTHLYFSPLAAVVRRQRCPKPPELQIKNEATSCRGVADRTQLQQGFEEDKARKRMGDVEVERK